MPPGGRGALGLPPFVQVPAGRKRVFKPFPLGEGARWAEEEL